MKVRNQTAIEVHLDQSELLKAIVQYAKAEAKAKGIQLPATLEVIIKPGDDMIQTQAIVFGKFDSH